MTDQSVDVFLAVVSAGSISGAAQALYITQPAVSRRLRELEEELGCPLVRRGKGVRRVELTEQGEAFIEVAQKWRALWQETRELASAPEESLRVSSVGSVAAYLLPPVLRAFRRRREECALTFRRSSSLLAYRRVEEGAVDLALISDDMFAQGVETVPAFREPMVLLAPARMGLPERVHPSRLDPRQEIRLPWNPEYDLWHGFWFSAAARPRVVLDEMALLEDFLSWGEGWAAAPLTVARSIAARQPVSVSTLEEGPPDHIIYYLLGRRRKAELIGDFLGCLKQTLAQEPEVECFL